MEQNMTGLFSGTMSSITAYWEEVKNRNFKEALMAMQMEQLLGPNYKIKKKIYEHVPLSLEEKSTVLDNPDKFTLEEVLYASVL